MSVSDEISQYLLDTSAGPGVYQRGQPEYYARLALEQAQTASQEGSYAIGVVAVVSANSIVTEFRSHDNSVVNGMDTNGFAEAQALARIARHNKPAQSYRKNLNDWTKALPEGVSIFGSIESHPTVIPLLKAGKVKQSIGTVALEELTGTEGDIGELFGNTRERYVANILFSILDTNDHDLRRLSRLIFEETKESAG
jgi:hypothetical protein